jgi:hypothetical protein
MPSACELPGRNGQGRLRLRAVSFTPGIDHRVAQKAESLVDRAVRTDKLEYIKRRAVRIIQCVDPCSVGTTFQQAGMLRIIRFTGENNLTLCF